MGCSTDILSCTGCVSVQIVAGRHSGYLVTLTQMLRLQAQNRYANVLGGFVHSERSSAISEQCSIAQIDNVEVVRSNSAAQKL